MRHIILGFCSALILIASINPTNCQITFPANDIADHRSERYAITNATIYTSPDEVTEDGTMLIEKGRVVSTGKNLIIPDGYLSIDMKGKTIYPAFIDLDSDYGMPIPKAIGEKPKNQPQMVSNKKGAYSWNEALRPEVEAKDLFTSSKKNAKEYRDNGIAVVLSHMKDGICRGGGSLVRLNGEREHEAIIVPSISRHFSFRKGSSTQNYPSSLMGAIALLKQTYEDAKWYKNGGHKLEINHSLQAWIEANGLIQIFEVGNWLELLRAHSLGKAVTASYVFRGNGDEYQRVRAIKQTGAPLIIPVNFPKAFKVDDPYDAELISYRDMKHWEMAPFNPAILTNENINFCITSSGDRKAFLVNLRKAIKHGLGEKEALEALTTRPASIIGASHLIGDLKKGKEANFIITSGNIFDKSTKIYQTWILGKPYVVNEFENNLEKGEYRLKVGDETYDLSVDKEAKIIIDDSTSINVKYSLNEKLISLSYSRKSDPKGKVMLSGTGDQNEWAGNGTLPDGSWVPWTLVRSGDLKTDKEENEIEDEAPGNKKSIPAIQYPFVGYGWSKQPESKTTLIKNTTVWTNEEEGILLNTDVLLNDGKIQSIGKNLPQNGADVIDGTGKHLTCGIIDEHSHIAISRGVNEGTQSSSAEVSIADVVNSEDINIYRQLAGGVTTSQLLHGSANPIGGQSALIKLRWGSLPSEMLFENAAPFIKFALGENVKQSNWGDNNRSRFPQTRMGVEQVFDDYFTRAKEYKTQKMRGTLYRVDHEMETILEILEKRRFITCHSYQQGEINMLMKMAEKHGFTINTFTHILEGFKVADKMKKHGAGASSFSDWWAYKFEVKDAIPYNGAILHEQGIVTAFNSDDAEMARRLNQEAAKAIKYGGISEEEAWKFVTLNPAKLLHIDDRVGSIKVGKDADVVLWSQNPLSVFAKAEYTFVDGDETV